MTDACQNVKKETPLKNLVTVLGFRLLERIRQIQNRVSENILNLSSNFVSNLRKGEIKKLSYKKEQCNKDINCLSLPGFHLFTRGSQRVQRRNTEAFN